MILLRRELGDVLREHRQSQGRTLREVSASASVSLGYLSEVERGEGTVYVALVGPMSSRVSALALSGDRADIRAQTVRAALMLLAEELAAPMREELPHVDG